MYNNYSGAYLNNPYLKTPNAPIKRPYEDAIQAIEYHQSTNWPPPDFSDRRDKSEKHDKRKKKRSRWEGGINEKVFIPGLPTVLPSNLTADQEKAYLLQLQIEEISRRLRTGDLGIPANPEERSPSPEPIYNTDGKRLNTREFRTKKKLEDERHTLIQEMFKVNTEYKPPLDYKPPQIKVSEKVMIPQEEHPEINFVGLLIGPRGNTLKSMEKETGAKIIIRGKGSVKEGKVLRKIGQPLPGEDEPLHAFITGNTQEAVKKAVDKIKEIIRQGIEVPEGQNDLRRMQLRELALLNGTLRECELGPRCSNCGATSHRSWQCPDKPNITNSVVCANCGSAGHIARDCRQEKSDNAAPADKAKIDEEYMSLMAELGEGPPPPAKPVMSSSTPQTWKTPASILQPASSLQAPLALPPAVGVPTAPSIPLAMGSPRPSNVQVPERPSQTPLQASVPPAPPFPGKWGQVPSSPLPGGPGIPSWQSSRIPSPMTPANMPCPSGNFALPPWPGFGMAPPPPGISSPSNSFRPPGVPAGMTIPSNIPPPPPGSMPSGMGTPNPPPPRSSSGLNAPNPNPPGSSPSAVNLPPPGISSSGINAPNMQPPLNNLSPGVNVPFPTQPGSISSCMNTPTPPPPPPGITSSYMNQPPPTSNPSFYMNAPGNNSSYMNPPPPGTTTSSINPPPPPGMAPPKGMPMSQSSGMMGQSGMPPPPPPSSNAGMGSPHPITTSSGMMHPKGMPPLPPLPMNTMMSHNLPQSISGTNTSPGMMPPTMMNMHPPSS